MATGLTDGYAGENALAGASEFFGRELSTSSQDAVYGGQNDRAKASRDLFDEHLEACRQSDVATGTQPIPTARENRVGQMGMHRFQQPQ